MSLSLSEDQQDQQTLRAEAFKEVFGAEVAPAFLELKDQMDAALYENFKSQIAVMAPFQAKVSELSAKVPKFWITSLSNCSDLSTHLPKCDHEALGFLTNVEVVHKADAREYDVNFSFAENPYFSNPTLTLSFGVTPPAGEGPAPHPHDLQPDLYMKPVSSIQWKSDAVNLVKKAPRIDLESLDEDADVEFNEETGIGSFFNYFALEGEDEQELGEALLEWRQHALEYATGSDSDWDSDDDSDDGENDGQEDVSMDS